MNILWDRMLRAAKLDAQLYEEVEADTTATRSAAIVVVLSAVAAGIGNPFARGLGDMLIGVVLALIAWYVWAFLTYYIGTRFLPEPDTKADHGELLRTLGFAAAPGILRIGGVIPGLGALFVLAGSIWMLVAAVIAVRQALDYESSLRAIAVCALGWIAYLVMAALPLAFLGP